MVENEDNDLQWWEESSISDTNFWANDTECKDNERDLYSNLTDDAFNKFAPTWTYYKTSYDPEKDPIYGEDNTRFIQRKFFVKGYIDDMPEEVTNYHISGIMGIDIVRVFITKSHFKLASTYGLAIDEGEFNEEFSQDPTAVTNGENTYESFTPKIGDILLLNSNKIFYEIINIRDTLEQFLNKPNNYELVLRVYKDNKLTVDKTHPTLQNPDDLIYTVAQENFEDFENFTDYLKINKEVLDEFDKFKFEEKEPKDNIDDVFGGW